MSDDAVLSIKNLSKTYQGGHQALNDVSLEIKRGEIFALLGPNGAGKTTLISTICGLVTPTSGSISVDGYDSIKDWRQSRYRIGFVPQELSVEGFETVVNTLRYSRQLFGKPRDDALIERIIDDLSLRDKRDISIMALSGGMKRRVLIGKALAHEPALLFLDEPTAGVDVSLRKDMWAMVRRLRDAGTTIFLTTHYIEEAEDMADRVGVIDKGQILLVEDKDVLMKQMGKKVMRVYLERDVKRLPKALAAYNMHRDGDAWVYHYDTNAERIGIRTLLNQFHDEGLAIGDIETAQSSLEDIFVELVSEKE